MKTKNRLLISLLTFTLVAMYGFLPPVANAIDSIIDAKDLITDSDVSVAADHVFTFSTTHATPEDGYIEVVFADEFGDVLVGGVTCPAGFDATAPDTETVRCTATALAALGAKQIDVDNITNPAAEDSYLITITNYDDTGIVLERVQVRVAIIQDVLMTARVNATLTFEIRGVAALATVNGETCDVESTATTTPFGTLSTTASTTVCQQLSVATNADDGFTVTVWEDQEMTSDSGSTINSFNNSQDGTGSTTPGGWAGPSNILDITNTYGHMGMTADDETLSGGDDFNATGAEAYYVGFDGTDPVEVMYHTGPADGSTPNKGLANVAYTTEITELQEAGDYENTLTYICTPQY